MKNYYFLANALPVLEIDSKPVISFAELMVLFEENLTKSDLKEVKKIRLYYDLINIERLLEEQEQLDFRGNLSENDLREALLNESILPPYVFEFFQQISEREKQLQEFPSLISRFFLVESEKKGIAAAFFKFERELKLRLVSWRSVRVGRKVADELRFEEAQDEVVSEILKGKSGGDQDPYEKLSEALVAADKDPSKEERAIEVFRFNFYRDFAEAHPFSLSFLLAFLMRLIILETLDLQTSGRGELILNSIVKDSA